MYRYREKLQVLELQNKLRTQPITFVNNGLIQRESGIIFHLSGVGTAREFPAVCSCDIIKPDCFNYCMDYLDYKESKNQTSCSEESTTSISESSSTVEKFEEPLCVINSSKLKVETSSETVLDSNQKQCRCKEELDRFLNSKCPCEECNQAIRQSYATHIMSGTTTTPSGNRVIVIDCFPGCI